MNSGYSCRFVNSPIVCTNCDTNLMSAHAAVSRQDEQTARLYRKPSVAGNHASAQLMLRFGRVRPRRSRRVVRLSSSPDRRSMASSSSGVIGHSP